MTEWNTLFLTFKLAFVTTCLLLVIAVPLAYWLTVSSLKIKPVIEALISMPLVLPPTVLGFYLLMLYSPSGFPGRWLHTYLGMRLAFSFEGLVLASVIYSLPYIVQPVQSGFAAVPDNLRDAARIMGKSGWEILLHVYIPTGRISIITGSMLAFAHTVGEFGVVLMVGGSIPGKTRTASIAVYEAVELMDYSLANHYALILTGSSFLILMIVFLLKSTKSVPF